MPHINGDIHFALDRMNRVPRGRTDAADAADAAAVVVAAASTVDSRAPRREGTSRVVIVITTQQAREARPPQLSNSIVDICRSCLTLMPPPPTPPIYLRDLIGTTRKQSTFQKLFKRLDYLLGIVNFSRFPRGKPFHAETLERQNCFSFLSA